MRWILMSNLILFYYLLIVNVMAFILYGMDKRYAVKKKYRIRESTLLGIAFIGGSLGALLAMQIFRHKTRKYKFSIGVPFFLILQIAYMIFFFD